MFKQNFLKKEKISKRVFKEFKDSNINYINLLNLKKNKLKVFYKKNKNILDFSKKLKYVLKNKKPAILIDLRDFKNEMNVNQFRKFILYLGLSMGELLPQNEKNDKIVCVYDRGKSKSMKSGARYHQTNEGGSIHTDNVNIPIYWDYLLFSCVSPAKIGGESIIVDGAQVYNLLKKKYPDSLKILKKKFLWEKRGISKIIFKAPIIKKINKKINFRYLRLYMESAHLRAKKKFKNEEIVALDILDRILHNRKFQMRFKMKKYQTLITLDSRVLHGRTNFKDSIKAVNLEEYIKKKEKGILKRTMERMWVKNR